MKFNSKYNVYVSKDGLIYYVKNDKLVLRKNNVQKGYVRNQTAKGQCLQHRIVWETFNGEIPDGYEVDHINAVRDDNRLCNLQMLTRLDNMRKAHKGRPKSSEQRAKMSLATRGVKREYVSEVNKRTHTGRHWFTNGIFNVQTYECPEGFVKGRVKCHM